MFPFENGSAGVAKVSHVSVVQRAKLRDDRAAGRRHLHVPGWFSAKFHAQGGFNKVYKIDCAEGSYIVRVPLPLDPCYKLSSEVATLRLIGAYTSVPVPKIIAYDDTSSNEFGFEWILMEFVQGRTLGEAWSTMSWQAKLQLTEDIARFTTDLFRIRANRTGNIYVTANDDRPATPVKSKRSMWRKAQRYLSSWFFSKSSRTRARQRKVAVIPGYRLDRLASMDFFWNVRSLSETHRGPFASTKDWLAAKLELTSFNSTEVQTRAPARGRQMYADYAKHTGMLMEMLDDFVKIPALDRETFALYHHDLHDRNIMVDEAGKITALLDWECVSVVPGWRSTVVPKFLVRADRKKRPNHRDYPLNNEGREVFAHHLQKFECSHLRQRFVCMMKEDQEWARLQDQCKDLVGFDYAVEMVDSANEAHAVKEWIEDVRAGQRVWSLRDFGDDEYLDKQPIELEPYR